MVEKIRVTSDLQKKGVKLRIEFRDDLGSNMLDAFQTSNESILETDWLGEKFFGYESQGREPISLADLENFIAEVARNSNLRNQVVLLINVLGSRSFVNRPQVVYVDSAAKNPSKKPHFFDRDKKNKNRFNGRGH